MHRSYIGKNVGWIVIPRHLKDKLFLICWKNSIIYANVCVMGDNEILLLLQVDRAIAAFAANNFNVKRERYVCLCHLGAPL